MQRAEGNQDIGRVALATPVVNDDTSAKFAEVSLLPRGSLNAVLFDDVFEDPCFCDS